MSLSNFIKRKVIKPLFITRRCGCLFISLINSFKKNGFCDKYPVELNKRFEIFEGSHRLACSLYFKISEIPVTFNTNLWDLEYDYSLEWFKKNNLTEYINVIKERYKNLF